MKAIGSVDIYEASRHSSGLDSIWVSLHGERTCLPRTGALFTIDSGHDAVLDCLYLSTVLHSLSVSAAKYVASQLSVTTPLTIARSFRHNAMDCVY